jgi:c-di-GMP-binding flagellar brake protein YcgR
VQRTRQQKPNVGGILELWDRLEITIEERGRSGRYRSRVEDITSKHLVIDRPTLVSGDALFTVGVHFRANFFKPDSAYTFSGQILSRHNGRADAYLIPLPTDIERNQRRRYFRLGANGAVTIIPAEELFTGKRTVEDLPQFHAHCINISGNGVLVRSRLDTKVGSRALVVIKLEDYSKQMSAFGIIRRRVDEPEEMHQYGIELFTMEELTMILNSSQSKHIPKEFLSFDETQRTGLLNFIFEQQVEMKKKGLI